MARLSSAFPYLYCFSGAADMLPSSISSTSMPSLTIKHSFFWPIRGLENVTWQTYRKTYRHIYIYTFWHYDDLCPPVSGRKNVVAQEISSYANVENMNWNILALPTISKLNIAPNSLYFCPGKFIASWSLFVILDKEQKTKTNNIDFLQNSIYSMLNNMNHPHLGAFK